MEPMKTTQMVKQVVTRKMLILKSSFTPKCKKNLENS